MVPQDRLGNPELQENKDLKDREVCQDPLVLQDREANLDLAENLVQLELTVNPDLEVNLAHQVKLEPQGILDLKGPKVLAVREENQENQGEMELQDLPDNQVKSEDRFDANTNLVTL